MTSDGKKLKDHPPRRWATPLQAFAGLTPPKGDRKKRLFLFNKAAILIVLAGMASFVDAYWIEPNWLKTEKA